MRILVISDTHGRHDNLEQILLDEGPVDMLIHCGDLEGEEETIFRMTGPECACIMVPGNNDFFTRLPRERTILLEGYNIWITHGHNYYVNMDAALIADEAASRGMNIVMFGHTHKPLIEQIGSVLVLNPGSLTYPRQAGRKPSYIILELDKDYAPKAEVVFLD